VGADILHYILTVGWQLRIKHWIVARMAVNRTMFRYKGRTNPKEIERDFPHIVETVVPPGGLGKRLNDMYDFHAHHGIRARLGLGRRDENGRDVIR
jgi:hypothetical protein